MEIKNSVLTDIEKIFELYRMASDYQRSKNVVIWPEFDRQMVETEIAENRQYKLEVDGKVACVWCYTFSDPEIWEERENPHSIYIHRIATNPECRGLNFVGEIIAFTKQYASTLGKTYIRLDTLGYNQKLIAHYTANGFEFLGMFHLENTANLPKHYQDHPECCLFEIKLDENNK